MQYNTITFTILNFIFTGFWGFGVLGFWGVRGEVRLGCVRLWGVVTFFEFLDEIGRASCRER